MEANYFTILRWFLPYIDMNQPWVYTCSPILNTLPPPFPSHPSRFSQCTGSECPVSCIKLGLVIYSHMAIYMFQCCSLKSSHPRFLPQSPKVCSLHLCLFCCLAQVLNIDLQKWIPGLVKPHIYTDRSKSERKTPIQYINTYIWN